MSEALRVVGMTSKALQKSSAFTMCETLVVGEEIWIKLEPVKKDRNVNILIQISK